NVGCWSSLHRSSGASPEHEPRRIEQDHLVLPEVMLEGESVDLEAAFRPTFDVLWNSCGWARSFDYDDQGKFRLSTQWREMEHISRTGGPGGASRGNQAVS